MVKRRPMAKKKPKDKLKDETVRFKASAREKAIYESVGERYSESMSAWIRSVLKAELIRLGEWKEKSADSSE